MDLIGRDSNIARPAREGAVVPFADGRRQNVDFRHLERPELASRALAARNARDERDVRRTCDAGEKGDEALDPRFGDGARRGSERNEEGDERSP